MTDLVIIPLGPLGVLELTRQQYEAALRPIEQPAAAPAVASAAAGLVNAKVLAAQLSLPVSCVYEYARAGRIPATRVGKHIRFSPPAVLAALRSAGGVTAGHS